MNDFTKEELEYLLYCVDTDIDIQDYILYGTHSLVKDKIESMIHNYCKRECNHESDGYDYFKIGQDELLMDVLQKRKHQLKCNNCQRIYDDNQ